MAKTKIVATLGPACSDAAAILSLIERGVDIFRINFSQGSLDQHVVYLDALNKARERSKRIVALMGDLCGPKIRTGRMTPDAQTVKPGEFVTIEAGLEQGNVHHFETNYEHFVTDVRVGHRVFIDDGKVALKVIQQDEDKVVCEVILGGVLKSRKGINLPDTLVSAPSITEYDWQCAQWAVAHNIEFLALSFVRSVDDINRLREFLNKADSEIRIVAKLETPQAIQNQKEIILASDAALVARGDLGVEMDLASVPLMQKQITQFCRDQGKPVIVATHMLQSMIDSPTATRAEVSDIANAIIDFTDAVLLSGETAIGLYPDRTIDMINNIALVTEGYLDRTVNVHPKGASDKAFTQTAIMAGCAGQIVDDIQAKLVVVWSQGGGTAQFLGKTRVDVPILAMSSSQLVCRQMCLNYGVIPYFHAMPETIEQFTQLVDHVVKSQGLAEAGDKIVLVTGQPLGGEGTTNAIVIHTVTPGPTPNP
jgi:pyruvate kinase